ncbi:hypothetical protein [Ramlibacter sp. AN1133]|uniref:hypothetical protein n=1 Tax=Ramlibacter sp. AN1133 TaxID=3133429 RepID=UPI0030BEFCFF
MGLAEPACELAPERAPPPKEKLETALGVQVKTLNSASLLFSRTYLDDASRVVNIFGGLARYPTHVPCESRQLVSSLADYLTHRTREEVLPGNVPRWSGFVPLPMGIDEIDRMGSVEYAKRNLDRWGASQARR